jgi:hypothetical protein
LLHVFTRGFQLPLLTVLSRMTQFGEYTGGGVSALPVFVLTGTAVYGIWAFQTGGGRSTGTSTRSVKIAQAPKVWK